MKDETTRRGFVGMLAGLPLVGGLVRAAERPKVEPLPVKYAVLGGLTDLDLYGVEFTAELPAFDRTFTCRGCGFRWRRDGFEARADFAEHVRRCVKDMSGLATLRCDLYLGQVRGYCPCCVKDRVFDFEDAFRDEPFRSAKFRPEEIVARVDRLTGRKEYTWVIPDALRLAAARGDLDLVWELPHTALTCVLKNRDMDFGPGVLKETRRGPCKSS